MTSSKKNADVLADDPSMKVTEVMKELGVRWKLLEDDEKTIYEDRVTLEKQLYIEKVRLNYVFLSHTIYFTKLILTISFRSKNIMSCFQTRLRNIDYPK